MDKHEQTALEVHQMEGTAGWRHIRKEISLAVTGSLLRLTVETDPAEIVRLQERFKANNDILDFVKQQVERAL